jgi:predicted DNA-binding protein
MKRINYHLTEQQLEKLKKLSKLLGLPVAEIIRRAIDKYFENER